MWHMIKIYAKLKAKSNPYKIMLTRKKRKILFWLSIIAFFILIGPVLIYSSGFRLGPDWNLVKTGGVFIRASKSRALVNVEGAKKHTSMLTRSALIKNVSPGVHRVTVSLDGYYDWKKTLEVSPEMVTSREALLVPMEPNGEMLGTTSPKILESPFLKKGVIYSYIDAEKTKSLYSGVKKFWYFEGDFLILGEDGNFYKRGEPFTIPESWGEKAKNILTGKKTSFIRKDSNRIIYWDDSGIDSYWISDIDRMPQWENPKALQEGVDRYRHIYSTDSGVRGVAEYPEHQDYLLAEISNGIYILEMDASGGQNIFPLYFGKEPTIIHVPNSFGKELIIKDDVNYIGLELP